MHPPGRPPIPEAALAQPVGDPERGRAQLVALGAGHLRHPQAALDPDQQRHVVDALAGEHPDQQAHQGALGYQQHIAVGGQLADLAIALHPGKSI